MRLVEKINEEVRKQLRDTPKWEGKKLLFLLLSVAVFVGFVDLFKAFQMRSISEAIAVVVIWLILGPAFAFWWSRNKSR